MRKLITSNIIPVTGRSLSVMDLRFLAQNEPEVFVTKIQAGVDAGKLKLTDIRDWRGLYQHLADVEVPIKIEMDGMTRAISTQAFPILTGTLAIAAINEAYQGVTAIGDQLVTDFDDVKKVTTIVGIHTLDKAGVDEVKELRDYPEIGVDEEKVEIRHKPNGRRLRIGADTFIENEVADIETRINALGEIAGEWIEEQTLERVMDYDGSASSDGEPYVYRPNGTGTILYSSTANTPGTRAPLGNRYDTNPLADETDLDNARTRLRSMRNARGKRINIPWSEVYFLVPDALEGTLMKILNSVLVPGVENEKSNWGPEGKYYIPLNRVLSTPKVDDYSTGAWYLGAFKRQFKRKWKLRFEYVSLGQETQAYLNNRVAFQARLAWDVEIGATDYVFVIQNLVSTNSPKDD